MLTGYSLAKPEVTLHRQSYKIQAGSSNQSS
jgi:hypothetical protein